MAATADILALGGAERLYARENIQGTGSPASWNGTAVIWTDATANNVSCVASTASVPTYLDDPGDGNGPVAVHANNNGFIGGATGSTAYVGGTTWTAWAVVRASDLSSYRNVFSSDTGTAGSLYGIAGRLYIEDGSTEDTGIDLTTDTDYRVVLIRTATNYRVYVDGSLAYTTTGITPAATPTFVTASYGGDTNAPWTGWWYAWGVHSADLSASIAALDAAMLEYVTGAAGAALDVSALDVPVTLGDVGLTRGMTLAASALSIPITLGSVGLSTATGLDAEVLDYPVTLGAVGMLRSGTLAVSSLTMSLALGDVALGGGGIEDDFAGDGPLIGYATVNASAITDVSRTSGSYRAAVTGSTADTTAHYNALYGRGDGRVVSFVDGFDVVYRNCRVRTPSDPDTAPTLAGTEYLFCGVQANNDFLGTPTAGYQQLTGGHRGPNITTEGGWTVEGKTTISSSSSVTDAGGDAIVTTKAIDIRVVGTSGPNTIAWYWRVAGDTAWIPYSMPGTAPTWNDEIYLVLITYAFGHFGPDFAGYIDAVELAPVVALDVGAVDVPVTLGGVAMAHGRTLAAIAVDVPASFGDVELLRSRALSVVANDFALALEGVGLTQSRSLPVSAMVLPLTFGGVALGTAQSLDVGALSLPVALGNAVLARVASLAAGPLGMPVTLGAVSLTRGRQLGVSAVDVPVTLGGVTLGGGYLSVAPLTLTVTVGDAGLIRAGALSVGALSLPVTLGGVTLGSPAYSPTVDLTLSIVRPAMVTIAIVTG